MLRELQRMRERLLRENRALGELIEKLKGRKGDGETGRRGDRETGRQGEREKGRKRDGRILGR
jgi:hypothetical protein